MWAILSKIKWWTQCSYCKNIPGDKFSQTKCLLLFSEICKSLVLFLFSVDQKNLKTQSYANLMTFLVTALKLWWLNVETWKVFSRWPPEKNSYWRYRPISQSQIPECTCSISQNAPFRTEMCTFLFWMEHSGIWNRCILGFVNQVTWSYWSSSWIVFYIVK